MFATMKLTFLGAARQVTGSCYLLEAGRLRLLIDCGLYQERSFLSRNWEPMPVAASNVDYLLLTHAHLDHSGLIPKLVRDGFAKRILSTPASRDLAEIILMDAAHIQEEDAEFKKRRHRGEQRQGPHPVVPLYTTADAKSALELFKTVRYNEPKQLNEHVTVTFHDAGHILGSAMLELTIDENGRSRTLVFSGDIGQQNKPIIRDPSVFDRADYVVMESTYGDRNHEGEEKTIEDQLCEAINRAVAAGGNIVIPTFAVERAQELMFYLGRLVRADRIPHLMAFLDSPMAVDVTEVFRRHQECMDEGSQRLLASGGQLFRFPGLSLVRAVQQSKAINRIRGSCIIMAGSGMCTAGRIKHHLAKNISRPESTILIVGYQAGGTLGRQLVDRLPVVRILGAKHEVRAHVEEIHGLSAHADQRGLMTWLGHLQSKPRCVFLTHGEQTAAEELAGQIRSKWGWHVVVPSHLDECRIA
jgi:metallo-beta-lactamase family protein